MTESQQAYGFAFDEEIHGWVVKMQERCIVCSSESDARCIASLPIIHAKAADKDLFLAEERTKYAFCESGRHLVKLVNHYGLRCKATRDIERAIKRIEQRIMKKKSEL